MSEYDQIFDPNILIGHCDLISRFSDFALYLDTQLVYLCPPSEGVGGHIVFGVDPVGVSVGVCVGVSVSGVAFCLHNIS